MKEIRLNLEVIDDAGLNLNEFCALLYIYSDYKLKFDDANIDYKELQTKQYIKIIKNEKNLLRYILREKGKNLIEFLLTGKKKTKNKKPRLSVDLITRLDEFRDKWKGLKVGSMGSLQSCKVKLARWMEENPSYSYEDILKAADLYIDSLNGDYRYLQRADYFIYKQENNREESSRLSAFIDEIDDVGKDWTTKLK